MNDQELVKSALSGDTSQFSLLVARYQVSVRSLCRGYLRDEMLAEDIAQEAFVRAYNKLNTFDVERSFKNWLLTIAANLSKDELRRRKRQEKLKDGFRKVLALKAEETEKENRDLVRECLKALSADDREILVLREYLQLGYDEIAEILSVTKDAVRGRLKRARKSFDNEAISRTN